MDQTGRLRVKKVAHNYEILATFSTTDSSLRSVHRKMSGNKLGKQVQSKIDDMVTLDEAANRDFAQDHDSCVGKEDEMVSDSNEAKHHDIGGKGGSNMLNLEKLSGMLAYDPTDTLSEKLPGLGHYVVRLGNDEDYQLVMDELKAQHQQVLEAAKRTQRAQQVEQKLVQFQCDKLKLAEEFKKQQEKNKSQVQGTCGTGSWNGVKGQ